MIGISPYVITVIASIIISQTLKYIILAVRGRAFSPLRQIYASGNMPSTHSTAVVSLVVVIGFLEGVDSGLFGLSLLLAIIVMYDAVMLRRSVGDQGLAVQSLIKVMKSTIVLADPARGHTPLELAAGAVLGTLIGIVVFFATN